MNSRRCSKIDLALVVHHVVVLEDVLADVEVARLDLLLRLFERLVDPGMGDRLAFLEAERAAASRPCARPRRCASGRPRSDRKNLRAAGVALAAGAAAQLVVDAAALVALGAEHVEAAGGQRLLLLRRRSRPRSRRASARCVSASSMPRPLCSSRQSACRMSTLPPSWMSVPRPAMLVAMVTAPGTPAWATMMASCSW